MEYVAGNIFVRENAQPIGGVIHGHSHTFDHASYVRWGGWRFQCEWQGKHLDRIITPWQQHAHVLIRAGVEHEITRVEVPPPDEMKAAFARLLADTLALTGANQDVAQKLAARFDATALDVANPPTGRFDCIYSHRTPQGDVVEEYSGWDPAYV